MSESYNVLILSGNKTGAKHGYDRVAASRSTLSKMGLSWQRYNCYPITG